MRRNNGTANNGKNNSDSVRLSAYITPEEKAGWCEMIGRASEVDDIKNPDNGTFLARIIKKKLRLDKASLERYVKTHKRRDQTPART